MGHSVRCQLQGAVSHCTPSGAPISLRDWDPQSPGRRSRPHWRKWPCVPSPSFPTLHLLLPCIPGRWRKPGSLGPAHSLGPARRWVGALAEVFPGHSCPAPTPGCGRTTPLSSGRKARWVRGQLSSAQWGQCQAQARWPAGARCPGAQGSPKETPRRSRGLANLPVEVAVK